MARKTNKRTAPASPGAAEGKAGPAIGRAGLGLLAAAFLLVCAGYLMLKKTAPDGRDAFAALSAALLLAGYLLVPAVLCLPPGPEKNREKTPDRR